MGYLAATLAIVTGTILLSGCPPECNCGPDRVCENGVCVDRSTNTCNPSCSQEETCLNGSCVGRLSCGSTFIACNCTTTTLYPGEITSNQVCASGEGQAVLCGYSCGAGGQAWAMQCYCGKQESSCVQGQVVQCGSFICPPGSGCAVDHCQCATTPIVCSTGAPCDPNTNNCFGGNWGCSQ